MINSAELFMYMCEVCGTVSFSNADNGRVWCTLCQVCKLVEFHEKVVIKSAYDMFGVFKGNRFMLEEKVKNDSKEEG